MSRLPDEEYGILESALASLEIGLSRRETWLRRIFDCIPDNSSFEDVQYRIDAREKMYSTLMTSGKTARSVIERWSDECPNGWKQSLDTGRLRQ